MRIYTYVFSFRALRVHRLLEKLIVEDKRTELTVEDFELMQVICLYSILRYNIDSNHQVDRVSILAHEFSKILLASTLCEDDAVICKRKRDTFIKTRKLPAVPLRQSIPPHDEDLLIQFTLEDVKSTCLSSISSISATTVARYIQTSTNFLPLPISFCLHFKSIMCSPNASYINLMANWDFILSHESSTCTLYEV